MNVWLRLNQLIRESSQVSPCDFNDYLPINTRRGSRDLKLWAFRNSMFSKIWVYFNIFRQKLVKIEREHSKRSPRWICSIVRLDLINYFQVYTTNYSIKHKVCYLSFNYV
jgi:hypothetical protein